ncbi:unnamed protein product, partial [Allacma fusca]
MGTQDSKMEEQEHTLEPTEEQNSESVPPAASSSLNTRTVKTEITVYPRPITSGFDNPLLIELLNRLLIRLLNRLLIGLLNRLFIRLHNRLLIRLLDRLFIWLLNRLL